MRYKRFWWVKNCENLHVFENTNSKIGYYIEADWGIPHYLHDKFSELPILLTHEEINKQR